MGLLDRLAPRRSEPDVRRPGAVAVRRRRARLRDQSAPQISRLADLARDRRCCSISARSSAATSASSASSSAARSSSRTSSPTSIVTSRERHARGAAGLPREALSAGRRRASTASSAGTSSTTSIARRRRRSPTQLTRVLRPDGALLGFFGTAQPRDTRYTKYIIVDEVNLKHRSYRGGARTPGDPARTATSSGCSPALRVSDSFLLQNNLREILFRKPLAVTAPRRDPAPRLSCAVHGAVPPSSRCSPISAPAITTPAP